MLGPGQVGAVEHGDPIPLPAEGLLDPGGREQVAHPAAGLADDRGRVTRGRSARTWHRGRRPWQGSWGLGRLVSDEGGEDAASDPGDDSEHQPGDGGDSELAVPLLGAALAVESSSKKEWGRPTRGRLGPGRSGG